MNSKQIESGLSRQGSQPPKFSGAAQLSVGEALASSRANLRAIEEILFRSDSRSPAGLLLSQLQLLLTRLEVGVAIDHDAALSLLVTATKVADHSEVDRA